MAVERKPSKKESNEVATHDSQKDNSDTKTLEINLQPITTSNEIIKEIHEESPITSPEESVEEFPLTPQSESMEEVHKERSYKRREQANIETPLLNELTKEETRKRRRTSIAVTLPYEQLITFDGIYGSQRIEEVEEIKEPIVDPIVEQRIPYPVPFPSSYEIEYQHMSQLSTPPTPTSFTEPIQYLESFQTIPNEVEPPKSPLKHGDVFLTEWPDSNYMEYIESYQ
ncbi:14305_t:CDS:2 [Cetraspora pellucida]|uniref:14305_t:CDS:1 n=1 Tax=Cetraspora pellucida TaxID=1433469 RepID=A0ACA9N7N2_9GLOM|nr:14305_t:CDS:2 [Cetraspora pellucida]